MDRNIAVSRVLGDSKVVIKWMNDLIQVTDPGLLHVSQRLKLISAQFQDISFTHIFGFTLYTVADSLSKEALRLDINKMITEEFSEGNHFL